MNDLRPPMTTDKLQRGNTANRVQIRGDSATMTTPDSMVWTHANGATQNELTNRDGLAIETRILTCVDRGLGSLGSTQMRAIYWHLEQAFGLRREDIPRRSSTFVYSIRQMLHGGAEVIERAIAGEIRAAFEIPGNSQSLVALFDCAISRAEHNPTTG